MSFCNSQGLFFYSAYYRFQKHFNDALSDPTSDRGNALGLQRVLGLGSYQTAWSWLHKMRRAMVRPGREKLSGNVEVDETFVGGEERGGKRGRGAGRKSVVVIAIEVHEPKGFGRVRMQCVPDAGGASLIPFVCHAVAPGSVVFTDSRGGYNDLSKHGYTHKKTNLSDSGDPAHVVMPGVHRIASLLKRWLLGTHQGAVSDKHLDYYLDEYTFPYPIPPVSYNELVHGQKLHSGVREVGQLSG